MPKEKSYRAARHDVVRKKQRNNAPSVHRHRSKMLQVKNILLRASQVKIEVGDEGLITHEGKWLKILELFAGQGDLTKIYEQFGVVDSYDKTYLKTGDSYIVFHRLIGEKRKYDVIDLDPYGFPNRFFPDIFLLIDDGFIFITMPKPYVNIMNAITQQHMTCYYGEHNPKKKTIIERIKLYGLCHWRELDLVYCKDFGRVWRFCFKVTHVKATEYCGVKNR